MAGRDGPKDYRAGLPSDPSRERHLSSAPSALDHRGEIDGLRAVAVVAVVVFHVDPAWLPGGFVGVDVFFVISGFLITRQIRAAIADGTFGFRAFYARRARRLLPAAAATGLGTVAVGILVFPPPQLRALGASAIAMATSTSNIYFSATTGYWDLDAAQRPLLHTWSLGVEEQFYLLWPMVVWLLVRRGGTSGFARGLVVITLASAWVSALVTLTSPELAFYMMHFRIHEFAVGALCVLAPTWPTSSSRMSALREVTAGLGAALVAVPLIAYGPSTEFPGLASLAPAIGTAMVILANGARLSGVLRSRAARWIGDRSYSIYLVHWPVLVYVTWVTGQSGLASAWVTVPLMVVLSIAQYEAVEQRFRATRGRAPSGQAGGVRRWRPAVVAAVAVAPVVLATAGVIVVVTEGLPNRRAAWAQAAATSFEEVNRARLADANALCGDEAVPICGAPAVDRPNVLVVGDSIAADGLNILATAVPQANLLLSGRDSCQPWVDPAGLQTLPADCQAWNALRFQELLDIAPAVDLVVLSSQLHPSHLEAAEAYVTLLREHELDVVVLGVGHILPEWPRDTLAREGAAALAGTLRREAEALGLFELDLELRHHVEEVGATYHSRLDWLCPRRHCRAFVEGTDDLVQFDSRHLTLPGAKAFARHLEIDLQTDLAAAIRR